jgi:predicted secreted protein
LAKYVVTGNTVKFNNQDISASVARAELVISSAEVDVTDFASGGWTEVVGGLKAGSVSLTSTLTLVQAVFRPSYLKHRLELLAL